MSGDFRQKMLRGFWKDGKNWSVTTFTKLQGNFLMFFIFRILPVGKMRQKWEKRHSFWKNKKAFQWNLVVFEKNKKLSSAAGKVFYFRKFICQHQKRGHLATMFLLCEFGRKVIQFDKKRQRKTVPCRKNIQKQCFVSFWDKINKTLCAEATNFTEIGPSLVYFWQNLAQPDSIFGPSENSVGPKIESGPGRVS